MVPAGRTVDLCEFGLLSGWCAVRRWEHRPGGQFLRQSGRCNLGVYAKWWSLEPASQTGGQWRGGKFIAGFVRGALRRRKHGARWRVRDTNDTGAAWVFNRIDGTWYAQVGKITVNDAVGHRRNSAGPSAIRGRGHGLAFFANGQQLRGCNLGIPAHQWRMDRAIQTCRRRRMVPRSIDRCSTAIMGFVRRRCTHSHTSLFQPPPPRRR